MSIRDAIRDRVAQGRLFELFPSMPSDPHERTMFMSEEINALVMGPWSDQRTANRCMRLRGNLEEFLKGEEELAVSLTPYEHDTAFMGRLDRPVDEVWDIRSRAPKPGMRVLGRFSERDTFVALNWGWRKDFKDRRAWGFAIAEAKTRWNKLFSPHEPPFYGEDDVNVYLTNAYLI